MAVLGTSASSVGEQLEASAMEAEGACSSDSQLGSSGSSCSSADSTLKEQSGDVGCGCSSLRRSAFASLDGHRAEDPQLAKGASLEAAEGATAGESAETADVVYLQGGVFTMGIVPEDEADGTVFVADLEGPARNVSVSPFGLGKFEVSNARFAEFVRQTGYVTEAEKFGWSFGVEAFLSEEVNKQITTQVDSAPWWLPVQKADWGHPNGPDDSIEYIMNHPVTQVSLNDAEAFCKWSRPGGRVPTEAEWEFAARGGKERRRFPWGHSMLTGKDKKTHRMNVWQSEADKKLTRDGEVVNVYSQPNGLQLAREYYLHRNLAEDGYVGTAPVDAYGPQNGFGLYNLVGNVWEWTSTPWGTDYPEGGPGAAANMVKKGGSFMCNKAVCNRYRCSARTQITADSAASNVGFRCAYPPAPQARRE
eukprot:CAMPEP_0178447714 /NCGR_PEP_ID=MMETSP0689_2-20121128/41562_1 /TAXON_ID=160604 /ORGANISM="Amphidinium massartii, Strain CS-259" /LENGTH=419 /DNA_ID=CAMNT_0020072779 /DNA_START=162 /DNA_END=1421 /DNA_ORIENTATION=+